MASSSTSESANAPAAGEWVEQEGGKVREDKEEPPSPAQRPPMGGGLGQAKGGLSQMAREVRRIDLCGVSRRIDLSGCRRRIDLCGSREGEEGGTGGQEWTSASTLDGGVLGDESCGEWLEAGGRADSETLAANRFSSEFWSEFDGELSF